MEINIQYLLKVVLKNITKKITQTLTLRATLGTENRPAFDSFATKPQTQADNSFFKGLFSLMYVNFGDEQNHSKLHSVIHSTSQSFNQSFNQVVI